MRSSILINIALLSAVVATARAQIVNGRFEGGVTGGCPNGWICEGNVSVFDYGATAMVRLDEPATGAVSRLYQEFNVPPELAGPARVSFRYAFASTHRAGPVPATVPPDSFTAFLVDSATGGRLALAPDDPPFAAPGFWGQGYFCHDTDGAVDFADAIVQRSGLDSDGLFEVVFETTLTSLDSPRIEFGLAGAANKRETFIVLDNVQIECPLSYCCDDYGQILPKYDGEPCTKDICEYDANDALVGVGHPEIECCEGCIDPNGDLAIMFMIDVSGSMPDSAFSKAIEGMKNILAMYEPNTPRPSIGVGRFSTQFDVHAVVDIPPSTDYAMIDQALDALPNPQAGATPLAAAIGVASTALGDPNNANSQRYIVLLTDGFANIPKGVGGVCHRPNDCPTIDPNDPNDPSPPVCACKEAREAAADAAAIARSAGIEVYTKLYFSNDLGNCPLGNNDPNDTFCIRQWLRDDIVSGPQALIDADPNNADPNDYSELPCDLVDLVLVIICDDGDPNTLDTCNDGECQYTPVGGHPAARAGPGADRRPGSATKDTADRPETDAIKRRDEHRSKGRPSPRPVRNSAAPVLLLSPRCVT